MRILKNVPVVTNRTLAGFTLAVLLCAGARAATTNTTLAINASGSTTGTSVALSGTASLSGIGSGTFAAAWNLTTGAAPFTITFTSGTTGALTGTLTIPSTLLAGSGNGSATVTGGSGNYAGATGSFPSLAGTATVGVSISGSPQELVKAVKCR